MKNKLCITVCIFLAIFWVFRPFLKLAIIHNCYQLYGSYIIHPDNNRSYKGPYKPKVLKKKDESYSVAHIRLTNILYYPELLQLSFGIISDNKESDRYEIIIVDEYENELGLLLTEGQRDFYKKSIEKLHYFFNGKLNDQHIYRVLIIDNDKNLLGCIEFSL